MEDNIELKVLGITYTQLSAGAYALLLQEVNGNKRIPIVVGMPEAQSITLRLQNVVPPRPNTHDLTVSIMRAHGIVLEDVLIYRFKDGMFMSELHLKDATGRQTALDCRSSDAIALALRTGARIFTTPQVMEKTGIEFPDEEDTPPKPRRRARRLIDMTVEELQLRLSTAVERENYELAARIQKIIQKKTNDAQEQQ